MLKALIDFPDVVTLIPNSGIQFLDFGFKAEDLGRLSRYFWPEKRPGETDAEGRIKIVLHPLTQVENGFEYQEESGQRRLAPEEECQPYRALAALEVFDGEWLPAPVLRRRVQGRDGGSPYDRGPLSWSRIRVAKLAEPDQEGNTHRATLGFDTSLGPPKNPDFPYVAPEPRDAADPVEFQLVSNPDHSRFYLEEAPIKRWLRDRYLACLSKARGRRRSEDDIEPGEYWAQYIMLVEAVAAACKVPRIDLVDTVSDRLEPIDVDLVIDVGNNRTCGILIERSISLAAPLELRDLTRPEFVYSEPFETRVEFSPAAFGSTFHARRVGRSDAFWWPSIVRVGPEASWLTAKSDGTEGLTGLSSPKRYLWDRWPRPQPWANTRGLTPPGESPPEIKGPLTGELTEAGDVIRRPGAMVGTQPRYSRASLYTLMLVELLSHALIQINSPASRMQRSDRNLPRRLRDVILTLPSATPLAEQKALRQRARDAIDLLWKVMKWGESDELHKKPRVLTDWDEATCTHIVYLYNEIAKKYRGLPRDLFKLLGEDRKGAAGGPALRIASMDIGGGTTDLMIIEHEVQGQAMIHPNQLFREGFRLAGDDIMKMVIEDLVVPAFRNHLETCALANPGALMSDLFGGDRAGMSQQERTLRALFVNQVFVPIAIGLLGAYEKTDSRRPGPGETFRLADLIEEELRPQPHVRGYLEREAERRGARDFSIDEVPIPLEAEAASRVVNAVVGPMVDDLCDVVRAYDCDLLLLSGRPSRLPAIRDRVYSQLPLPPHRTVLMHRYEVANWYPFRASDFTIRDPKTTAVVGAMLCKACEGADEGMHLVASEIRMKSTARYIGVMNIDDRIVADNVLLENVDLDTGSGVVGFEVTMERPMFIGFRQLPIERWKTQPLYYLNFRSQERLARLTLPIAIKFERQPPADETDEMVMEDFRPVSAEDREGNDCLRDINFRVQTLRGEQAGDAGYWLDTGMLRTQYRL